MYQEYDDAVAKIEEDLRDAGRCTYSVNIFIKSANEFKAYLQSTASRYSTEHALEWLKTKKESEHKSKYDLFRTGQFRIAEQLCPSPDNRIRFYSSIRKWLSELPEWCHETLLEFEKQTKKKYGQARVYDLRVNAAKFMVNMLKQGVTGFTEISCSIIANYSKTTQRNWTTPVFLNFLADADVIPVYAPLFYEASYHKYMKHVDKAFQEDYSISEVYASHLKIIDDMKAIGYAKSTLISTNKALNSLGVFLTSNNIGYSNEVREYFLEEYRNEYDRYALWRPLHLLEGYLSGRKYKELPKVYIPDESRRDYPLWFKPFAIRYIDFRKLNHVGPAACATDKAALLRLSEFLDSFDCKSINGITRQMLKDFNLQDEHKAKAGKALYNRRIRNFLRFLYDEKILEDDISTAIPIMSVPRIYPTVVLTDELYDKVLEYCQNEERKGNYLNSAILKIGLWTGLRSCDICNLKFTAISLDKMEFTLVQQKTGIHISVPFPSDVGNTIYNYITLQRRADADNELVFHQPKAPFSKLTKSYNRTVILNATDGQIGSFHILRKTFATRMLRSGTDVVGISDAIGHVSTDTVDPYIDTDYETMRECALSLTGFSYKGGLL